VTHFLLALHLVFAVFAVGPLVHAATTAGRGVRRGDGAATAASARMLRVYSAASVLVILAGGALMSRKDADGQHLAEIGDTWIWLSLVLWGVAIGIVLLVLVPALTKVTQAIERQESVVSQTAKIAAAGGVVGVLFAAVVTLMAYKPGH